MVSFFATINCSYMKGDIEMKYSFLKRTGNSLFFDGEYMEIYIPKDFFKQGVAEYQGDKIKTLGIFNFMVYTGSSENRSKGEIHLLKLPMEISFEFDAYHDESTKLTPESIKEDYRVFELSKGSMVIDSVIKEQSAENSKKFIKLLHGGNLPKALKYEDIIELYHESIGLNKVKLNNPSVIFEMIIAELCRYNRQIDIPFRSIIGKSNSKVSQYDYSNINLKKLPAINSTFNALTFEDINQAIISSVTKTVNGDEENPSPVEEIIKY
jgi:hypothetical protein